MIRADFRLERIGLSIQAEFSVPAKGVTAIFGPSGSGKTTLLRVLAGLEPAVGSLTVNDACWLSPNSFLVAHKRRLGYVFQEPSLFTHLSVWGNLQYGWKRGSRPAWSVDDVVEMLSLGDLLKQRPETLSGGEQQRVAIARALLGNPRLLLFDEPLSALDIESRSQLMPFLEKVLQHNDIPAFYVSHSPDEVARLADHLILMEKGRVVDYGALAEMLGNLDSNLALSDEAFSVLEGTIVQSSAPGLTCVKTDGGHRLYVPLHSSEAGSAVRLKVSAKDVSLCLIKPDKTSIINILPSNIKSISKVSNNGSRTLKLDAGGAQLLSRVSDFSCQQLQLRPGLDVFAQIKSAALVF